MSKTITCSGTMPEGKLDCSHSVTAETVDEAINMFHQHAMEAHADMMASATDESKAAWEKNMRENVWPNTPDHA